MSFTSAPPLLSHPSTGGAVGDEPASSPRESAYALLRARLVGTEASDRLWGWLGPLLVTAFGGVLRFWHLDRPPRLIFDETYYVKQASSLLDVGYELAGDGIATPAPDDRFASGTSDVFGTVADFVVHPPVGKWMIAVGEALFGTTNPWGWRFAAAFCGTLSIFMIARIGRRLLGSTLLGCTAGLLLAVDGQHLVHSRTGLLDVFVMFWALAAFGCIVLDRFQARDRLARRLADGAERDRFGPGLGIRWWRVAAGVCLGLLCGVKWSGLFFVAVFGLATVLWDVGARRAVGTRGWLGVGLVRDGSAAALQMLPAAVAAYLAGWAGWFASSGGYLRLWAVQNPSGSVGWVPGPLRSLWHYHSAMYDFHVGLDKPHPYQSNPWSWAVLGRPTAFWYEGASEGVTGCGVKECAQAVLAVGNPVIWWGGTIAVVVLVGAWALERDWRAGAVLAGLAAGYLPWFLYQDRTIYSFYAVAFVPWIVLALTYVLGRMLGRPDASPDRRLLGALFAGFVVVLALACFAWFYPVYVAEVIPRVEWSDRMWLPSWI
jgi:dolichyl-phosphate-mannose--protein O-mannosyl transferase